MLALLSQADNKDGATIGWNGCPSVKVARCGCIRCRHLAIRIYTLYACLGGLQTQLRCVMFSQIGDFRCIHMHTSVLTAYWDVSCCSVLV